MLTTGIIKTVIEIDEWASARENYSYTMSVNKYGISFWLYNHKTDVGQTIKSTSDIDENKLEGEDVCEKLEEQSLQTS